MPDDSYVCPECEGTGQGKDANGTCYLCKGWGTLRDTEEPELLNWCPICGSADLYGAAIETECNTCGWKASEVY